MTGSQYVSVASNELSRKEGKSRVKEGRLSNRQKLFCGHSLVGWIE